MPEDRAETTPFRGRWLLVRVDDDDGGKAVALELDDYQVVFTTCHDEQLEVLRGTLSLSLTGLQTIEVQKWWRETAGDACG
jgi:hypothetical protein